MFQYIWNINYHDVVLELFIVGKKIKLKPKKEKLNRWFELIKEINIIFTFNLFFLFWLCHSSLGLKNNFPNHIKSNELHNIIYLYYIPEWILIKETQQPCRGEWLILYLLCLTRDLTQHLPFYLFVHKSRFYKIYDAPTFAYLFKYLSKRLFAYLSVRIIIFFIGCCCLFLQFIISFVFVCLFISLKKLAYLQ